MRWFYRWFLFKKDTTLWSYFLIAIVRILQPNYFILQPVSPSLLFHVNGASESLNTRVFETRTATGSEYLAPQDSRLNQTFKLRVSNSEKILSDINIVVWRQVKRENISLSVAVRVSKTRVLNLPNVIRETERADNSQLSYRNPMLYNLALKLSWAFHRLPGPGGGTRLMGRWCWIGGTIFNRVTRMGSGISILISAVKQ